MQQLISTRDSVCDTLRLKMGKDVANLIVDYLLWGCCPILEPFGICYLNTIGRHFSPPCVDFKQANCDTCLLHLRWFADRRRPKLRLTTSAWFLSDLGEPTEVSVLPGLYFVFEEEQDMFILLVHQSVAEGSLPDLLFPPTEGRTAPGTECICLAGNRHVSGFSYFQQPNQPGDYVVFHTTGTDTAGWTGYKTTEGLLFAIYLHH